MDRAALQRHFATPSGVPRGEVYDEDETPEACYPEEETRRDAACVRDLAVRLLPAAETGPGSRWHA